MLQLPPQVLDCFWVLSPPAFLFLPPAQFCEIFGPLNKSHLFIFHGLAVKSSVCLLKMVHQVKPISFGDGVEHIWAYIIQGMLLEISCARTH